LSSYRIDSSLWYFGIEKKEGTRVLYEIEELKEAVERVHEDLGHYGKTVTWEAVKMRFIVASDLFLKDVEEVLDSCIPCQLYKDKRNTATATIHPYDVKDPFACWGIDFVGPLKRTPRGNEYLITAIDFATSKALAFALERRSAEAAIEILEEIVWTYGAPKEIITDNGQEFRSNEFLAIATRYGIKAKHTSPGHPQTNGKVERFNHEITKRLQRISAEEGKKMDDWDLYLRKALFAFAAHINKRYGCSPFFLTYGTEPTLPTAKTYQELPPTYVEREETIEIRRTHVQNLNKYRTEAANRYREAIEKLATTRDDGNFNSPILPGDLVMRSPINRKTKLHPKWDGPFVVLASTDKDVYQLATANGYTIRSLVNEDRLRKLEPNERTKYAGEFWEASNRLKSQDARAKEESELRDIEKQLRQATLAHLESQKVPATATAESAASPSDSAAPDHMTEIATLSAKKREIQQRNRDSYAAAETPTGSSNSPPEELGRGKRQRRPVWKRLGDAMRQTSKS